MPQKTVTADGKGFDQNAGRAGNANVPAGRTTTTTELVIRILLALACYLGLALVMITTIKQTPLLVTVQMPVVSRASSILCSRPS